MINKGYVIIWSGLLIIIAVSVMLHFEMRSLVLYVLLVIGSLMIGLGILLGFIKMVTDDKQ